MCVGGNDDEMQSDWLRPILDARTRLDCSMYQTLPLRPPQCHRSWKGLASETRRTTRYQAVTLSTQCALYRQQICAIFFLFSALGAEVILSLGLSWPFFFHLKRLFTITINYSRTERMMRREGYNNSGCDC